jgi:hypothetical protein
VATEAATNLVKHANGGQLLVRQLADGQGIEFLALDTGPGIRNVRECLRDGYSTAGSLGIGLGAITRLATFWDIYSGAGMGTALLVRIHASLPPPLPASSAGRRADGLDIGVACAPKAGEEVCGDVWAVVQQAHRCLIIVADGLGHGPQAAEAAHAAVRTVYEYPTDLPAALLERMHDRLRSTRGAAVAIAEVDSRHQILTFAGVGNVAGTVIQPEKTQQLMSHNGTIGYQIRKIQALTYPWSDNALLVLHSDGLATRWQLHAYPDLVRRHPSLIAGVLYRDFARGRDDVTVVVARAAANNDRGA